MIRLGFVTTSLAGPILLAAGLLEGGGAALAQAPCVHWDVSGQWSAIQGGGTPAAHFSMKQSGSTLAGTARQAEGSNLALLSFHVIGLEGSIQGTSVEIVVRWSDRSMGVYNGTIGAAGSIEGTTLDRLSPNNRTQWRSSRAMNCLAWGQPPIAKRLGKKSNVLVPEPSTGPSPFGNAKPLDAIRETDRGILLDP